MSIAAVVAVAPFWKELLLRLASHLPKTALILLLDRIETDDPMDRYVFNAHLLGHLQERPATCISRWDRSALWRWQWRLLAARDDLDRATLLDVATMFARPAPQPAPVVTHEEMLAIDHDETGRCFGALQQRLRLPPDTFLPEYETSLAVKWLDLQAYDGASARLYLISSVQRFAVIALRRVGGEWRFAGSYDIRSKYADPDLQRLESDASICLLSPMSTGGTGVWEGSAAWLRVNERGLEVVHRWATGGHRGYSRSPFNYEYTNRGPTIGHDERGRFVDHALTVTITNAGVFWDDPGCDPADAAAVQRLDDVFERTGVARYRWDADRGRFEYSAGESAWTNWQVGGSFYEDDLFLEQNFDRLVDLAGGADPAGRAWVRLMLTRLEDSRTRRRFVREINGRESG